MANNVKVLISEKNGVEFEFQEEYELKALNIPYDNTDSGLASTDVKAGLDEIYDFASNTSSPGFIFTFPGNNTAGSWAEISGVPSNRAGLPILQNQPTLRGIAASNETITTCTIEIYEHDGTNFTLIDSITITADRKETKIISIPATLTKEKELAAKISSGSLKNGIITCIVGGTFNV